VIGSADSGVINEVEEKDVKTDGVAIFFFYMCVRKV